MAVNAKFSADFSSFNDAIAKADVKLADFSKGANNVERSLNRMVDNFSGRKLIQDASLMMKAIDEIGGSSKLTGSELQSAGAKASEAAAKMKAMGLEVPPGFTKLATEADRAAKSSGGLLGGLQSLNGVLGIFGASLSVGALVNFGRDLLDTADHLVKVADGTGLTSTEVQRLQFIAEQSGNSLEQMTGAVSKLQAGLAGNNAGVVAAVKDLGLNFSELRRANPYEQIEQVATAIQKVEDPTARARLAVELFGRAGTEILPTLVSDFRALGDAAPVMSDKTVRSLERAGDQLNLFGRTLRVWAAESYNALGRFFDQVVKWTFEFQAGFINMIASIVEYGQRIPGVAKLMGVLGISVDDLREQARFYTDAAKAQELQLQRVDAEVRKAVAPVMELTDATKATGKEAKKTKEALRDMLQAIDVRNFKQFQKDQEAFTKELAVGSDRVAKSIIDTWLGPNGVFTKQRQFAENPPKLEFIDVSDLQKPGEMLERASQEWIKTLKKVPESFSASFGKTVGEIPTLLANAFTGGGGIGGAIKAIGTKLGADLGKAVFGSLDEAGNGISGLAKGLSGKMASFVSGLGPVIGAAAGALGSLFGKLFGESAKEKAFKETKTLRDDFVNSFKGGFDELDLRARQSGITLTELWNAKTPEAYKKAVDDINKALGIQDSAMQTLKDTAAKYNIATSEMGPNWARQELHSKAAELIQDFEVLRAGGVDYNTIVQRMGPTLQDYVVQSAKAGIEIPKQFEPIIKSMMKQGLLTDENGEKLVDVSQLKFGEPIEAKFQAVIDKIGELVDAITRGLNPALLSIPHPTSPWADWGPVPSVPAAGYFGGGGADDPASYGSTGGLVTASGIQYRARGGMIWPRRGTDTVPAMLTPGERVLSVKENRAYEAGAFRTTALERKFDELMAAMADRDRLLPKLLRDLYAGAAV